MDQSNASDEIPLGAEGFKVNCFTKIYPQSLPQPKLGEVVILRNVKVCRLPGPAIIHSMVSQTKHFNGINGVGYHDKLQWAVYSPITGKVRHNDLGNVPESEHLANGIGYKFTPFFFPGEMEIKYCLRLSDWWCGIQKKRQETMGEVHQIGVGDIGVFRRSPRQHRLISEAGPEVPPQGYFDCTVEVSAYMWPERPNHLMVTSRSFTNS